MHDTHKRIAGLALTLLVLAGTAACGGEADGTDDTTDDGLTTVSVMMFPGQAYRLPVVLAEEEGFFADRDIKLEVVDQPNGITGMQGMEATKAEVGHLSLSTVVQGWQAGSDIPFFCGGIGVTQTTLMADTDSDLPSTAEGASWEEVLQALEGKKIGIQTPVGSGLQLLFAEALAEAGVEDVTYVNLGGTPTTTKAALENGSIDVAQINPPGTQLLESEGYGKPLIYMPEGPSAYQDYYGSALVAPREWLESEPETAAAFCDATQEALDFIADPANAEASAALLAEDTGVPAEAAALVVENAYPDFTTELPEETLTQTFDAYVDLEVAKPDPAPTYDELVVVPEG